MEISNETKAKEFANYFVGETDYKESDAYSASISMAEWKEQQLIDKANKKGAAYSAAMAMAEWKDEQHAKEKRQWNEEMFTLINGQNCKPRKNAQTNFKQSLKTTFRNSIERILDTTEKMCVIILVLILWLFAIGLVVFGINLLFDLL